MARSRFNPVAPKGVYLEKFDSLAQFCKAIEERTPSTNWRRASENEGFKTFYGTDSYQESKDLILEGYEYGETIMKKMMLPMNRRPSCKLRPSVVGSTPIVAKAIMGVPKAMMGMHKVEQKQRTIHFVFGNVTNARDDSDLLIKAGGCFLQLVQNLEKKGVRCKIDVLPLVTWDFKKTGTVIACALNIKDYREPLNIKKMAYPMAHASIFRRQGFKWLEGADTSDKEGLQNSYGTNPFKHDETALKAKELLLKKFEKGAVMVSFNDCQQADFDPEVLWNKINNK